jgi:membrane protein DedA with SNARE-associated domain
MNATVPLIAVAGLILVKEAGVPVPVPGDLVVIGAGVAASRGDFEPGVAIVVLVAASLLGGIVQYGLLRSMARPVILGLLSRFLSRERLDRQTAGFRRRGTRAVATARVTPGIRIVAIAASALAGVPAVAFIAGLAIGNGLFLAAHFGLGYLIGEPVLTFVGGALGPLAIAGLILAGLGLVAWFVLARRRGGVRQPGSAVAAWTDACCPACLGLALVDAGR